MSTFANSSSGNLVFTSDNESMLILAQPANTTETTETFNNRLERATIRYLASGISHAGITDRPPSDLTVTRILKADRDEFDIETTNDISDISFALMSSYDSSIQPTPDSYTYNIGTAENNIQETISINTPTISIYDSNVKFSLSANTGPFFSTSNNTGIAYPTDLTGTIPNRGFWEATFDETNPNVNYSKAINSEYNTTNYQRPLRANEFDTFNKRYSLGMDLSETIQNYYTLESNTGKPIPNFISNIGAESPLGTPSNPSFRLNDNGLFATKTATFANIGSQHYGSYRIQQFPDVPLITIAEDGEKNVSTAQDDLIQFPIFNVNTNSILPKNALTYDAFYSLFNRSVENIGSGYRYDINIAEKLNSGYSPSQDMTLRTDIANTFTLDDNSLSNNANYMKNYVNGNHSLSIEPASLSIAPVSVASPANTSLFSLNTQRELLTQSNFSNGQIKINNRSPSTRHTTSNDSTLSITPNVFYNTEDSKEGISDELKQNYSVTYLSQLVAKNSKDISSSFLKNSENQSASLDLFDGNNICNSLFTSSDFEFSATNPNTNSNAEVYKIKSTKRIANNLGFSRLSSNGTATPVNLVYAFAAVENLIPYPNMDNVFDTAKMSFSLKPVSSSSIHSNAIAKGWNLTTQPQYNGKIVSSVQSAYCDDTICFPSLEETKTLIKGGNSIKYEILVHTVPNVSDSVIIRWSTDNFVTSKTMTIPEANMTKTLSTPTTTFQEITTPLTFSGKLLGKTIKVYTATSVRNKSYSFTLPLRPFSGLTMTTPNITVNSTYYTIMDVTDGTPISQPKSYLQYVSDSLGTNYSLSNETFSSVESITGTLDSSDLCDMFVKVQGKDSNNNNIDFTNEYSVSVMYDIETIMELNDTVKQNTIRNGIFKLSITTESQTDEGDVNTMLFDSVDNGYVLSLLSSYKTNYSVEYWSANTNNIISNTNIATVSNTTDYSNKSLTISNGYSNITTWNNTEYYVLVTNESLNNSTTVLNICRTGTTSSLYEIRIKNSKFVNTHLFITNIPNDIYRVDRWIGQRQSSSAITFSEKFITVDYKYLNSSNIFAIDTGIYLTNTGLNSTTFSQLSDIGKYIKFSLNGDLIGVNMINNVTNLVEIVYKSSNDTTTISNHTISSNGLSFQYTNAEQISRILTIDCYRGFNGPTDNQQSYEQIYTIQRGTMVATFTVNRSTSDNTVPSVISQSFNVYYNSPVTVNNLSGTVGSTNVVIGDIGLKITFLVSMLTPNNVGNFVIYTMGDDITFSITNPTVTTGFRTAPTARTLKTFVLDTFSGPNFNNTGKALSIASYRLKIKTANVSNTFLYSTASWSVELGNRSVVIYKNSNYLGNPENLDTNNIFFGPDTTKWVNINPAIKYTFNNLSTGISIGPWLIRTRLTAAQYSPSISYFVILPPYAFFRQVVSKTKTLPYVFAESDIQESYLPISDTVNGRKIFNPFIASRTYSYIAPTFGISSVTITFDQTMANNITFAHTAPESLISNYSSTARTVNTQFFVVEGSLLKMTLAVGLKSQNGVSVVTLFSNTSGNSLPANRLIQLKTTTSNFYLSQLTNSNSGVLMKLLQPLNVNTPFQNLLVTDIFSSVAAENANVVIRIDNFFILPSRDQTAPTGNEFSLDLPTGKGTKISLLTHETISNKDGSLDLFVYKYNAINNIDYNNVNADGTTVNSLQTITLNFLERQYKKVSVSSSEYAAAFTQLNPSAQPTGTRLNQSYDTFIASQASKFDNLPWITDNSLYGDDLNMVYANIQCYTKRAQQIIPPRIFSTRSDGKAKVFMVFKYPVYTVLDKLGRKNFQITNWGSLISNTIISSSLSLTQVKSETTTGNFSNILENSSVGWSLSPVPKPEI